MARTLLQVQQQIAELRELEERLKSKEAAGVAARIKEAIAIYNFTPEQLFGAGVSKPASKKGTKRVTTSTAKLSQKAQYADDAGNEWVGRGPRPPWLRQALEAGKSLADFAVGRTAKKTTRGKAPAPKGSPFDKPEAPPAPSRKRAVKYRDDQGNTWTGGGSQPRWLKAALADGKSLEDFRAQRAVDLH